MYPIDFNSYDHNFCESTIYSDEPHPEYLNSISSLFITFIGLNGLSKIYISFLLKILYSSLAINGITSCFYHYYNTIGWGLLDRMSMLIIAMSSINLFINNISRILLLEKWKKIKTINSAINLSAVCYFTILFTIAGLHMESAFNIMFGLFLGSLVVFMFLIDRHHYKLDIPYKLVQLGWRGIIYIAVSGVFWIVTENLCTRYYFIKYLFGHVWWHFCVSYGGYLISLIPCYTYLQSHQDEIMLPIILVYDNFNIPYLIFDRINNLHTSYV
jgi:hypothetical protein